MEEQIEKEQPEDIRENDEISSFFKTTLQNIKDMDRKDIIRSLVTFVMIVLLCGIFFVLGYGYSIKNSVMVANGIILEIIKDNPQIKPIVPETVVFDGYEFNTGTGNLTKMGGG